VTELFSGAKKPDRSGCTVDRDNPQKETGRDQEAQKKGYGSRREVPKKPGLKKQ
jgi:hypothetical protein